MKCVPIQERLVSEKTINRNAEEMAVACMPLPAMYVEVGVTTKDGRTAWKTIWFILPKRILP